MSDTQTRIAALIRRLYPLKEALAGARYQPDPECEKELDERFENLCREIEEAGGAIPNELI